MRIWVLQSQLIRFHRWTLSGVLTVVFCGGAAFSNPMSRSDSTNHGYSWFSGDQRVTYCVEDRYFNRYEQVSDSLLAGIRAWTDLFKKSKSDFEDFRNQTGMTDDLGPQLPPAQNFRFNKECNGREDLTLYYGVENARVRKAKAKYNNPIAFAELESFDESTGQGKGFIWISGNVDNEYHSADASFANITFHELGHVFGCDHIEGTIMDPDIAKLLDLKKELPTLHRMRRDQNKISFSIDGVSYKETTISEDNETGRRLAAEIKRSQYQPTYTWTADLIAGLTDGELTIYGYCAHNCLGENLRQILGLDVPWRTALGMPKLPPSPTEPADLDKSLKITFQSRNYFVAHQARIFRRRIQGRSYSHPILGVIQYGIMSERISEYDRNMNRSRNDLRSFPVIVIRNIHGDIEFYVIKNGEKYKLF